MYDELNKYIY